MPAAVTFRFFTAVPMAARAVFSAACRTDSISLPASGGASFRSLVIYEPSPPRRKQFNPAAVKDERCVSLRGHRNKHRPARVQAEADAGAAGHVDRMRQNGYERTLHSRPLP